MKIIKFKKIISALMLFLMLFSVVQPVFAASGSGNWVGGQYGSNMKTTDSSNTEYGILIRKLIKRGTGEAKTVFCAEHGVDFTTDVVYSGTYYTPTNSNLRKACKIAYLGWYKDNGDYVVDGGIMAEGMVDVKKAYVYTQQYIWETLGQSSARFLNSTYQSEYESFKARIDKEINRMQTRPSFNNQTISIIAGDTKTITDTNGVLSEYNSIDNSQDGIRFQHSKGSNDLIITVSDNVELENIRISDNTFQSWGMIKEGTEDHDTTVYFEFSEGQNQLYAMNYNDPVTLNLSLKIDLLGDLELSKLNTNGDLVDGAVFTVTGENDFYQEVTVTNGKIKLDKLRKGTYYVKEKSSPTGYLLNTETYIVEVKPNQTATQAIVDTEPTGEITVTKTNTNGDKVQGAKFQIIANEDIYNVARTVKHYSKGDIVATISTNSSGIAVQSNLPLGKYKIKEIEVPHGYLLNTEEKDVTLKYKDQNTNVIFGNVTIENEEPTGNLTIEKTDKETGNKDRVDKKSHHGDATLNGTEYTLYAKDRITNVAGTVEYFKKDEQIAKFTFNEYGVASIKITNNSTPAKLSIEGITLKGLPMGQYYAKETIVPTGYMKDTKVYEFTFTYKDMNTKIIEISDTATNTVQKAPFEVIKVTTNDNTTAEVVGDAEFTAILSKYVEYYGSFTEARKHLDEFAEDEYSIFKTGTDGHGISGLLAYGEYTVNETYTPSPEIETVEEFYVTIDRDSKTPIRELVENDLPFEAYIKLEKQDKKTGKYVTYSNATFELYKLNEDNSTWNKVQCKVGKDYYDSWTTDENGIARTETKLEAGTYKLEEIKIPKGFIQLDGELTFRVDNRNSTLNYDQDWDAWITVTAKNEQPTGTLKIDKKVVLREDVDKTLIKDIDYTKISFELVADENIIDYSDGSTIYEKGNVIGNYNLNKEGKLTITNLPMGKYHLKELTTIDGVALDETEHKVVFEQEDNITKEYVIEKEIENKTTIVEFSKTDITGEQELEGAKLTITDENNEIIDSWVSSGKTHKVEGLIVGKEYTLTEEIAPDGFVKATSVKFKIENSSDIQKVTMIDKQVTLSKKDIAGEEVEGAELKVVDKDGNVIDSWTSTNESHKIKGLVEGETYTIYEEYAPDGYVISNSVDFSVSFDKKTQELTIIDKQVEISKIDIAGEEVEGATLVVTSTKTKNIVDKWVSTKEPHKVNGLIEGETYILTEEIAPNGFVKATSVEFIVTSEKETQKIVLTDKRVIVKKTDFVTGEELEGAELEITDKDGNVIDSWTSSKEEHFVTGLVEGETYTLTEKSCPYGYEMAESIDFIVSSEKENQVIEMKDQPILKDIKIIKVDSYTKEVIKDKFLFGIYEDSDCTKLIREIKSNKKDGTVIFEDLRFGTYYIKELEAPKGYELSEQVIKVEINENGIFIDDKISEEIDNTATYKFENKKIEVPQTGDNSHIKLALGILILSTLGLAYLGIKIYKSHKENKNK